MNRNQINQANQANKPKPQRIEVNGSSVAVSHEIRQNVIHVRAQVGRESLEHRVTIGSVDKPLPVEYDAAALQKDLDVARQHAAEMVESKHRISQMLKQIQAAK
jgi:hypothetical protein